MDPPFTTDQIIIIKKKVQLSMVFLLLNEDLEVRSDNYSHAVHFMLALLPPFYFISALSSSASVRGPKSLFSGCFRQLLTNRDM